MPIKSYLVEGEKILAQAESFYATDKRLLRYKKHSFGEELDDIPYSHITSIGVVRNTRRGVIKAGIITAIIGAATLATVIAVRPVLKSISGMLSNLPGSQAVPGIPLTGLDLASLITPLIPLSVVVLALGVAVTAWGFFRPQVFIQFRAPGLNAETEAKFRLYGVGKEATLNLVRTVRQQSLAKESDSGNVRPPANSGNQSPGQPGP